MLASPVLVPLGRWCVKVKKTDWTKVKATGMPPDHVTSVVHRMPPALARH